MLSRSRCTPTPAPSCRPLQVARFAAEFMKRKLAEAAAASKSSRSRKSKAKAAAAAQPAAASSAARAAAPAVGPPGYAPPAPVFPALSAAAATAAYGKRDNDWEKVCRAGTQLHCRCWDVAGMRACMQLLCALVTLRPCLGRGC